MNVRSEDVGVGKVYLVDEYPGSEVLRRLGISDDVGRQILRWREKIIKVDPGCVEVRSEEKGHSLPSLYKMGDGSGSVLVDDAWFNIDVFLDSSDELGVDGRAQLWVRSSQEPDRVKPSVDGALQVKIYPKGSVCEGGTPAPRASDVRCATDSCLLEVVEVDPEKVREYYLPEGRSIYDIWEENREKRRGHGGCLGIDRRVVRKSTRVRFYDEGDVCVEGFFDRGADSSDHMGKRIKAGGLEGVNCLRTMMEELMLPFKLALERELGDRVPEQVLSVDS
jgi:hypothetical protein